MLVVATNQPGIELGYFSQEDFFRTNSRMLQLLAGEGVMLDKVYFSPASRPDLPSGRKPAPTMAQRAEEDLGVDLKNSFMIGDSQLDIGFAQAAGLQSVLVLSGKSTKDESQRSGAEYVAANFALAVDWIIREASSN
jgi:histidinol-phosphate phosphatase family protein